MLFSLVASGLWILTSLYAIGYMRGHHEENQTRFFAFAVAISAALAAAFSGNMLTLFFSYEVLRFLPIHWLRIIAHQRHYVLAVFTWVFCCRPLSASFYWESY